MKCHQTKLTKKICQQGQKKKPVVLSKLNISNINKSLFCNRDMFAHNNNETELSYCGIPTV